MCICWRGSRRLVYITSIDSVDTWLLSYSSEPVNPILYPPFLFSSDLCFLAAFSLFLAWFILRFSTF